MVRRVLGNASIASSHSMSSDLCAHEIVTKEMQADRRKRLALKYGSGVLGTGVKSKLKAVLFLVWSALSA